jgi:hypothetical protein
MATAQYSQACTNYSSSNEVANVVPLLEAYSSLSVKLGGTNDGKNVNLSESYNVVSSSSSQISVDVMYQGNESETLDAVLFTNGTMDSLSMNGTSIPSAYGTEIALGVFAGFILEIDYVDSLSNFTQIVQFHSTGSSTVTIGSVSIPVTTYAANSLPVTTSTCGGTDTLTAFSLTAGTPAGAKLPLVTSATLAGTGSSDGITSTYDVTVQVTGVTLA